MQLGEEAAQTRMASAALLSAGCALLCWCAKSSMAAATAIWKALSTDADSSSGGSPTDLLPITPCLLGESCSTFDSVLRKTYCGQTAMASSQALTEDNQHSISLP